MKRAVGGGLLSSCNVGSFGREGVLVSHLLFADNTLVFIKNDQHQLTFLCWLLMWFEALSGLNINLEKSELIPVGRVEEIELLAAELGVKWANYLLPTWGCHWALAINPLETGTVWKRVQKEIDFMEESIYF